MVREVQEDFRGIKVLSTEPPLMSVFPGNTLRLSRYTWLSILPKNLFEQFQRTSNIWFLIVSIFQLIPYELNPTDAWNNILPLSLLLGLTLLKDAYRDYQLKKQDGRINNMEYLCWNGSAFTTKKCKDILVGDIVTVLDSQIVPADMLLIDCSSDKKYAFIDMSRLTGASTLKQINAIDKQGKIIIRHESGIIVNSKLHCTIKLSEPSSDYNSFYGRFKQAGDPASVELKLDNLLFKGSILKGVENATCLALYCGFESKIQLNSRSISQKTSVLERKVNTWVLYILAFLAVLVFFSVIGFYFFNHYSTSDYPVLQPIVSFTLLYNNIIPISLFMVIDIIRGLQTYMITRQMPGVRFNTERINENLGQVEYILADKAAVVTENSLKIKVLIIDHHEYQAQCDKMPTTDDARMEEEMADMKMTENVEPNFEYLAEIVANGIEDLDTKEFMKCMALCHTLRKAETEFFGSYDEVTLVSLASGLGFKLLDANSKLYVLEYKGIIRHFDVIATRPFSTENKKSRVLLCEANKNYGILYVKGDANSMMPLIHKSKVQKGEITQKCNIMNDKGLRTMILAFKKIPLEDILEIRSKIKKAEQSLLNYEGKLESMFKEIEKKINYLGITCIEEEISLRTMNTISLLKKAKIKFWMLSGDSNSNTDLVGKSSGIIDPESRIIYLKSLSDEYNCLKTLKQCLNSYVFGLRKTTFQEMNPGSLADISDLVVEELAPLPSLSALPPNPNAVFKKLNAIDFNEVEFDRPFEPSKLDYSVCIDRKTFITAMGNESCRKLLVLLLVCAKSACFSMLMPKDKGDVVKLLKENVVFKPLVVAVGSGEGDISMLQAADVGISMSTHINSILQNFSDIKISSFCDLQDLILKYGHWNYMRLSRSMFLFLYKNFFLTLMLLAFMFQSSYSGTSLFDASLLVGYNIFFTTLPVLVIGVLDEDLSAAQLLDHPEVYIEDIQGISINWRKLLIYLGMGVSQGILLSVVIFPCLPSVITANGYTVDLEYLGTTVYLTLILAVLIQIHLDTHCYSLIYYVSQALSIVFVFIFVIVENQVGFNSNDLVGVGIEIGGSPYSLFSILFTSVLCVIPSYAVYTYREIFYPNLVDKLKANYLTLLDYNKLDFYKNSFLSLYRYSTLWKNSSKDEKFSMSKSTLRYNLPYIEKEFKAIFISENLQIIKWTAMTVWILLILWTIFGATLLNTPITYTLSRIVITAGFGVLVFILFTDHFVKFFTPYTLLAVVSAQLIKFALEVSFNTASVLATALVPSITFILLNVDWYYIGLVNILNIALSVISLPLILSDGSTASALTIIGYLILIVAITITSAIVGYYLEAYKRTEYKLMNITNAGVERTQNILSLMLPPFVRNRVKEGIRYIAENKGEVTVLFCDICDFEGICKDYRPRDLRIFLDSLFKIFDALCENSGVTKIETVGKTYMACAGLQDSEQELAQYVRDIPHARRAIELALSMIQEVSTIRLTSGSFLQVKIGINTGTVVAGVVGYHKPQFSLVGDTVNTASRMCSTLKQYNSAQISESTYEYLKNYTDLGFEEHVVEAKGKGNLNTFTVTEVKDENSSDIAGGPNSSIQMSLKYCKTTADTPSKDSNIGNTKAQLENKLSRANTLLISDGSIFSYHCNETAREKEFRHNRLETSYQMILMSLIIALITYCINLMLSILQYYLLSDYSNIAIIIGRSVVILCILGILLLHHKIYKHLMYGIGIFCVLLLMLVIALFNLIYSTSVLPDFTALEIMYIIVILNHSSGASIILVICANIVVFVPWVVLASYSTAIFLNITNIVLVAVFSIINSSSIFIQERKHRRNYNLNIVAKKEIKETEKLLVHMMPRHVLEGLQNDISETDKLENITILFADIVGFTNWSSNKSPEEVVQMLSELFSRFDKKCLKFDVYKVHTIGDCYVVLGFSGDNQRDPARECLNMTKMAYSMVQIIKDQNKIHDSNLNMRIGIHTGEVIAGVIGTNIVRYDIWGPDVLIANKMESSGKEGWVNISQATKELLEGNFPNLFEYSFNSEVTISALEKKIQSYLMSQVPGSILEISGSA